jgi:hypothetical protein
MVRVWYQACPHDASGGAGTRRPVRETLCRIAGVAAGSHWSPGGYPGITGLEGAWRASGRAVAGRFWRLCACPGRPAGPMGPRPGRRMADRFRDPEFTVEDLAFVVDPGNWGCPKFPRKPDVPRKWEQRDWCAAWGRVRSRWTRPRAARRPHGARRTGSGSPAGLPICGTRSTGHDLAARTAIDPGASVSVCPRPRGHHRRTGRASRLKAAEGTFSQRIIPGTVAGAEVLGQPGPLGAHDQAPAHGGANAARQPCPGACAVHVRERAARLSPR